MDSAQQKKTVRYVKKLSNEKNDLSDLKKLSIQRFNSNFETKTSSKNMQRNNNS